jgi:hypothetical protein
MNKLLRYSFVALLAMIGMTASAETIIWQEDFSSYAKNDVPQGMNSDNVSYSCMDGGSATKIYEEALAGGTSPELLVSKSGGYFLAVIPFKNGESGEMTLSFKSNKKLEILSNSENVTIGELVASGNDYTCTVNVPAGLGRLELKFSNSLGSNARLDNIKLYQGTAKKAAGLSFGTSARTVTIGANDNVFPTLTNANNLPVTYDSSEKGVATIAADGTITLVAAGSTVISAKSEETAEFEAGHAQYTLTVKTAEGGGGGAEGEITEITVAKALEIINALEDGKTTADAYKVKGYITDTPDFQRKADDNSLYGNVNFTMADGDGSTALLTVFRAKDLENVNFTEETINRIKKGDQVVVQGKLQKYVKNGAMTPELTSGFLISVIAGGTTTEDTWTVAGTIPLTDKEWDPTDTNGDMLPNGNGAGVSSYERDNIVLEAGKNYEFKVVKNHSWAEAYPESNYVIKVDETAKYHVKIFFNTTTHEITYEIAKMGEAGPVTHTWSVIGTLVGNWDVDTEMTKGEDGIYKAEFENVAAGKYEFKVRADKLWTTAYPSSNYVLNVEKDGSNVTVTFDEAKAEVKAIVSMPIEKNAVWSFTSWKTSTVSALVADAAASKTSGWSDVEKAADAEAGADPTEASKNNCFWCVAEPNEDGTLSANGEVIEELKGLKWNKAYTVKRSLAIAVNYPTALSDYAGPAYLWLGGGKNKIPCFTIPGVKAGSTVTMEVESHKASDARGVELYTGVDADGLVDAATKIGDSFTPTTKDSHTWTIDADCDVIVYNTNGCHIYSIKVEAGSTGISTVKAQKTQNNVIYNLAGQKVGNDYKGIVIMNGKKFMQK